MNAEPHIAILGCGFAAIAAARALRRLRPRARIRLIAPAKTFLYRPSLIWVPVGLRKAQDIEVPLTALLAKLSLDFTPAHVVGLADRGRIVLTSRGEVRNDALIVATGADLSVGLPGAEHALGLCDGVAAAERVRTRLLAMRGGRIAIGCGENAGEPGASRAGPMLELLFGLDTWLRRLETRARFALSFFSSAEDPLKRFGASAAERLNGELQRRDIETLGGLDLRGFSPSGLATAHGTIGADLIVYTPGLGGAPWLAQSDLPRSAGGFVAADEYCSVQGFEAVYTAGDVGSFPGPIWSPKLAHMAQLQANVAAANLHAELNGDAPSGRLHYELACVIDTLDGGILLFRDDAHSMATPDSAPMHWAKRAVERRYLSALRD